ncbi:hypothetical protein SAMN05443667_1137 [Flavobacterium gillisiae]|uniref:Uncharacterized protein n=1 Tax=Flavobacterium gillisiae TaxID=150146 RepID=A0A1H4FDQ0_9FLAO|nr:hypothetical protein [Flavobacterium gillisiae]SEA94970.1 hypothetical protein SAMN05443667_1137 [Flavobacterium gillisiae]
MEKKINSLLNDASKKVENIEHLGAKITAGRVVPTPSNSLKPKIIVKPKNDEEK